MCTIVAFWCVMEKLLIFNICKISVGVMWNPRSSFDTVSLKFELLTTKTLKQNSNRQNCIEFWVKSIKQNSRILDAIYPTGHPQKSSQPLCMYARMPHSTAQFVLKIAKLSHVITLSTIIGTAPTLKMAHAYGLRLLWNLKLLFSHHFGVVRGGCHYGWSVDRSIVWSALTLRCLTVVANSYIISKSLMMTLTQSYIFLM